MAQSLGRIAEQQLVDKPLSKLLDQAFSGGSGLGQLGSWFDSLFGGGSTAYGTTGSATANVGAMTSGGSNPGFLLGGVAYGAAFEGGTVIPFARGGIANLGLGPGLSSSGRRCSRWRAASG